jgi:hypothetical protein
LKLSIVVASMELAPLDTLLAVLKKEIRGEAIEVILAYSGRPELFTLAKSHGLKLVCVPCPTNLSIFEMRKIAFRTASGGWINAIEPGNWDVLTGPVLPSMYRSPISWSIFFAEYSHIEACLAPGAGGLQNPSLIPGGNVVYRRSLVESVAETNEVAFHARLCADGNRFSQSDELTVEFASPPGWNEYIVERYWLSYEWGAQQALGHGKLGRLVLMLSRFALPFLLMIRRSRYLVNSKIYRLRFVCALPFLALYGFVEMIGEMSGMFRRKNRVRQTEPPCLH